MPRHSETLRDVCRQMSSEKYRDMIFRMVWVQNMSLRDGHNQFSVLFCSEKGDYVREEIYPEFLNYYSIGSYYRCGNRRKGLRSHGEELHVTIIPRKGKIEPIEDRLSDHEYALNQPGYGNSNKQQPCVVFEDSKKTVIVPCALIGAYFYFRTTSMRKAVLGSAEPGILVKEIVAGQDRDFIVRLKPNVADEAAPHMVRFCRDSYARNKWKLIYRTIAHYCWGDVESSRYDPSMPFEADIPVDHPLNMKVRGLRFEGQAREKIIVFEILEENSVFPFERLILLKDGLADGKPTDSHSWESPVPRLATRGSRLTDTLPSPHQLYARIRQRMQERNTVLKEKGTVETRIVPIKGRATAMVLPTDVGQEGRKTLADCGMPPEGFTRPGEVTTGEDTTPRTNSSEREQRKSYDYFLALIEKLQKTDGVANVRHHGTKHMPVRKRKRGKGLVTRSALKDGKPRDYYCVTFDYKGSDCCLINCCLIEIWPVDLPNTSTFVLTSPHHTMSPTHVAKLLDLYVNYEPYSIMRTVLEELKVNFFARVHPQASAVTTGEGSQGPIIKVSENAKEAWCKSLLREIPDGWQKQTKK